MLKTLLSNFNLTSKYCRSKSCFLSFFESFVWYRFSWTILQESIPSKRLKTYLLTWFPQ